MTQERRATEDPRPDFAWVDNAKAFLIFLVIVGHLSIVPGRAAIYAFHVPAFLFVTGFLLPGNFGHLGPTAVIHRWTSVQLRAYLAFSAASIAIWWIGGSLARGHPIDATPAILGMLYGVGGEDGGLVHENAPLWYFPFLAVSLAGAWACLRMRAVTGWALAVAWAGFALAYDGPRLPWCLDIGGIGVLTVVAGHRVRQAWFRIEPWLASRRRALATAALAGLLLLVLADLNGTANLNRDRFGQSGLLFVAALAAGIAMTVALGSLDRPGRFRRLVSRETLTIFAVHIYMVHRLNDVIPRDGGLAERLALTLGAGVAVLLASLGIALALRPAIGWLILPRAPRVTP